MRRYAILDNALLHSVSIDAALYHTIVNGEPVPYNGGRFYLTAGKVRRRGLELGLTGELAAGLSARFTGTFSANTYDEYRIDSTVGWRPPTAKWLNLTLGAQSNTKYFADDRNAVNVPGFTVWRAAVSAERELAGGVLARATIAAENLTDAMYVGSAFINPDYAAGQPLVYEPGLPRSLLVSLSFRRAR